MSLNEINQDTTGINPQNNARINDLHVARGITYKPSSGTVGQVLQLNGSGIPTWVTYSSSASYTTSFVQYNISSSFTITHTIENTSVTNLQLLSPSNTDYTLTSGTTIRFNTTGRYWIILTVSGVLQNNTLFFGLVQQFANGIYQPQADTSTTVPGVPVGGVSSDGTTASTQCFKDVLAHSDYTVDCHQILTNPNIIVGNLVLCIIRIS